MPDSHSSWSPDSWKDFPIAQQPTYPDPDNLNAALQEIKDYPPLVFAGEVQALCKRLGDATRGDAFVLQGGDCAERFQDCNDRKIESKLKILLQMSVILCYAAKKPIIRIGRIAGQYAKPRSSDTEDLNGQKIPIFRGDNVNSFEPDAVARVPDPKRLIHSYHLSSMTLNYVRALVKGGFADLHRPHNWDMSLFKETSHSKHYEEIIENIADAISFMESLGGVRQEALGSIDFFTSHEGLLLPYEQSLTRYVPECGQYFNLGCHMLWIGDRTRQITGAHVEYFRGIANPIGLKVGPTMEPQELFELARVLNPTNQPGRLTLITRFGEQTVKNHLPDLIKATREQNLNVLWSCDPMHGNIVKTKDGIKTRNFDAILGELKQSFKVHREQGTHLGGVHFELTGENVTECTGGSEAISEEDLAKQYETFCDPRLNYSQSLEMAFLISKFLKDEVTTPTK